MLTEPGGFHRVAELGLKSRDERIAIRSRGFCCPPGCLIFAGSQKSGQEPIVRSTLRALAIGSRPLAQRLTEHQAEFGSVAEDLGKYIGSRVGNYVRTTGA